MTMPDPKPTTEPTWAQVIAKLDEALLLVDQIIKHKDWPTTLDIDLVNRRCGQIRKRALALDSSDPGPDKLLTVIAMLAITAGGLPVWRRSNLLVHLDKHQHARWVRGCHIVFGDGTNDDIFTAAAAKRYRTVTDMSQALIRGKGVAAILGDMYEIDPIDPC